MDTRSRRLRASLSTQARLSDVVEAQSAVAGSAVPAIQAFFKCIALGASGRSLQDILRLLTLWFKHGSEPCVDEAIAAGVEAMSVDTWLAVTPQIIARIHHHPDQSKWNVIVIPMPLNGITEAETRDLDSTQV